MTPGHCCVQASPGRPHARRRRSPASHRLTNSAGLARLFLADSSHTTLSRTRSPRDVNEWSCQSGLAGIRPVTLGPVRVDTAKRHDRRVSPGDSGTRGAMPSPPLRGIALVCSLNPSPAPSRATSPARGDASSRRSVAPCDPPATVQERVLVNDYDAPRTADADQPGEPALQALVGSQPGAPPTPSGTLTPSKPRLPWPPLTPPMRSSQSPSCPASSTSSSAPAATSSTRTAASSTSSGASALTAPAERPAGTDRKHRRVRAAEQHRPHLHL